MIQAFRSKLTLDTKVHREEPRSCLLSRRIEHYRARQVHAEIASQIITDENEYYWTDQTKKKTAPPRKPAQQVSFKLKPWTKENTAEGRRTRPQPPPDGRHDPLGPFSHFTAPGAPATSHAQDQTQAPDQAQGQGQGDASEQGQYHTRKLSTRMVNVTVEVEGNAYELSVHPKELEKDLVHRVARRFTVNLPGYWHPRVISGT
jgi:hypothetical protein